MSSRTELDSLSDAQRDALQAIVKWHEDAGPDPLPLTMGGLAGTGKTTLLGLLPEVLPRASIAFVSFTGKAVSVLASKLPPGSRISTIHRLLYQPSVTTVCTLSDAILPARAERCAAHYREEAGCPVTQHVSFTPQPYPLDGLDLVVADEASMIPEQLWRDLTSHGVPVLAVGDHGQLPPVRSSFNLMAAPDLRLEEIHRQAAGSPVLAVARWAREQGHIPHGWYGPDVCKIRPTDLGYPGMGLHPAEADLIICATNATRQFHNAACRAWHGRTGPPQEGDVVTCLRNNYDEGLFNGQRGVVLDAGPCVYKGAKAYRMTVDLGLDPGSQFRTGVDDMWSGVVAAAPFGSTVPPAVRDRDLALFDYGYAITCHRAQGSQAGKVLVIEEGWPDAGTEMRRRWLYTAVTRAERVLTVVGW